MSRRVEEEPLAATLRCRGAAEQPNGENPREDAQMNMAKKLVIKVTA